MRKPRNATLGIKLFLVVPVGALAAAGTWLFLDAYTTLGGGFGVLAVSVLSLGMLDNAKGTFADKLRRKPGIMCH